MAPNPDQRFEQLLLPHLDAAYTLARYLLRDAHDAEDVVQEAALRAWRHMDDVRADGSARAWLLAIVRNTAHTWRTKRRHDAHTTEFDDEKHSDPLDHELPGAALERSDVRVTLAAALDRLAPEYREVIVLRELQELSYKEIGEITGAPIGTVMSRLSRARAQLRVALDGAGS